MTVTVAPATPEHTNAIVTLLEEMDRFYGETEFEPLKVRVRQVRQALFSDQPAAYALLAWDGDDLVGLASYSFLWPAVGLTRSMYLKELYIAEARWRTGIGSELMRAVFEFAAKAECSRVEWTTDDDNAGAQRFYEELGVSRHATKLFYRADHAMIERQPR